MSGRQAVSKTREHGNKEELAIRKLARAINLFRALDNTIPSQVISVFLEIADSQDGLETRTLPDRVHLSQGSVSRAILYLAETNWKDKSRPGLRLIIQRVNPDDARQRIVALTPKGRTLERRIEAIMRDG